MRRHQVNVGVLTALAIGWLGCGGTSTSPAVDAAIAPGPGSDASMTVDLRSAGDGAVMTGFPAGTICNDSGTPRAAPAILKNLIVVLFENEDFGNVNGNAAAPYISSLADACGQATSYADNCFAENLVSLPHYLALTSGSNCNTGLDKSGTGCITDDGDATTHRLTTTSIFDQVASWKSYEEGMPSACDQSSGGDAYACKHNPAAYYGGLSSCSTSDVAIASVTCDPSAKLSACSTPTNAFTDDLASDTLPALSFVTPNLHNDMHDGTVTQADNWLYTYLPLVFASKAYLRGDVAVLVLWDEQSTLAFGGATPNLFISPYITKGTKTAITLNHFAVLHAMESALGIGTYLGCAAGTLPGGAACPAGSAVDVRAAIGF